MTNIKSVDRTDIEELIKNWGWFEYVPSEAHSWLAERVSLVHHRAGEPVYAGGQPMTHVFGVLEGSYRTYIISQEGDEVTLGEEAKGAWFPHYVLDDEPKYFGECNCVKEAVSVACPRTVIEDFATRWPLYFKGQYREFLRRSDTVIGRIELLSLHTLPVRLAVYLLRLETLRGQIQPDGTVFIPHIESQTEIGARVGGTRQRINSLLNSWTRNGVIRLEKGGMTLLEPSALVAEAEQSGFDLASYLAGWQGGWERPR